MRGEDGRPLTRWDGRTKKQYPVTGEMVPDENARVEVVRLLGTQPASWPRADFIIGNPPFIGAKYLRELLGDGYCEALWDVYRQMPQSADYVMYWWNRAAQEVSAGHARRFGLLTTNCRRLSTAGSSRRIWSMSMGSRSPSRSPIILGSMRPTPPQCASP